MGEGKETKRDIQRLKRLTRRVLRTLERSMRRHPDELEQQLNETSKMLVMLGNLSLKLDRASLFGEGLPEQDDIPITLTAADIALVQSYLQKTQQLPRSI